MGVEHYPEVQLNLPVWYRVEFSRNRLNDIWIQENLGDLDNPSVFVFLNEWCKTNCRMNWHSDVRTMSAVWWFDDPRDAVFFKTVWA